MSNKRHWRDRFGWRRPIEITVKLLSALITGLSLWYVLSHSDHQGPIPKTGEVIYYPEGMSKDEALQRWGHELGQKKVDADKAKAAEEQRNANLRKGFSDLGKDSAEEESRLQAQFSSANAAFARGDYYRGPLVAAGTPGAPVRPEWANPSLGRTLDLPSEPRQPENPK